MAVYESSAIRGRTGEKETSGGRGEGAEIVGDGLGSIVEDPYKPKTEAQHSRGLPLILFCDSKRAFVLS